MFKKIQNRIFVSRKLGASFFQALKILFLTVILKLSKQFSFLKKLNNLSVKIKYQDKFFIFYPTDSSDLAVLEEIFIKDEYDFKLLSEPKIIFDLGGNVGLAAIYFKLLYPNAIIYSFEPDPSAFNKLNKNTKQFDNIHCFNLAISDKIGKLKFYVYPNNSMSSSLIYRVIGQKVIEVESLTLDEFMRQENISKIDLIKFDVEGAEMRIFKDFKNLAKVENFIGEVHLDLLNVTLNDFLNLFSNYQKQIKEISRDRRYSVFLHK